MRNRNFPMLAVLILLSLLVPFVQAQSQLTWGVVEGDTLQYTVVHRTNQMGKVKSEQFDVLVTVDNLPTIPDSVENMSSVPSAGIQMTFANGSSLGGASAFTINIEVLPLGTCDLMRPEEAVMSGSDYVYYWIEDARSYGYEADSWNIIATWNLTWICSKVDGALLSFVSYWTDIASGVEMEYLQIFRPDSALTLIITGGSICLILVVVILYERRRRKNI